MSKARETSEAVVTDIVLSVIHDGRGTQCGLDYAGRLEAVKRGDRQAIQAACREYGRYRHRVFEAAVATLQEAHKAAAEVWEYYTEELKDQEEEETR